MAGSKEQKNTERYMVISTIEYFLEMSQTLPSNAYKASILSIVNSLGNYLAFFFNLERLYNL